MQQPELCEVVGEPGVPWQVEAYQDQVSLYQGYGAEGSSEALVCCDEWSDSDVLMKPLARVKFEYFREKLGVLQIEVPYKGKWRVRKPF